MDVYFFNLRLNFINIVRRPLCGILRVRFVRLIVDFFPPSVLILAEDDDDHSPLLHNII